MFTGIVKGSFPVHWVQKTAGFLQFAVVLSEELIQGLAIGASVAIDGVCLTVTHIADKAVSFDVIDETLRRTTLDRLTVGQHVNVERSLRFGSEVGGHLLSGHIFGTGEIRQITSSSNNCSLTIACDPSTLPYILPKGFIAVDGVSLTVGEVSGEGCFHVHLIPETLRVTNLGAKKVGDRVNIELDSQTQAIVDTVTRYINAANL